jgi:hypothetical protein
MQDDGASVNCAIRMRPGRNYSTTKTRVSDFSGSNKERLHSRTRTDRQKTAESQKAIGELS